MALSAICCTKCQTPLGPEHFNHDHMAPCRRCGAFVQAAVFPALLKPDAPPARGQMLLTDDEASCFHHPRKQASVACDGCGRFLCALCDIEMGGRHLCPSCIERGASDDDSGGAIGDDRRVLYDGLALFLSVVPAVVTPMVSLFLAVRYWREPLSVVHRTRVRWYLAVMFSVVQLVFWSWLFFWRD